MLGLRFGRSLISAGNKIVVRNYRGNRLVTQGSNPGLDRRLKAFKEEGLKIEDEDAEEFIEASDSNFANVGEAYNEHLNETLMGKYDVRHRIVKEKYFKENMPNLLTWSEKEQIRHLATTVPEEWTPERIAESFPVTVPIVKKLLKYPWKPATEHRIARHDASVLRNWRELQEGTFRINEDLRKHFLKFSNRTIPSINKESLKINVTPNNKNMGEFERIVRRCAPKEDNENSQQLIVNGKTNSEKELFNQQRNNNRMTLNELAEKIQKRLDSGSDVDINDKIITKTVHTKSSEVEPANLNMEMELYDTDTQELKESNKEDSKNEKSIMVYPERIRIPKKAYKRGATYKVNDCYYDHDGRFLYRVLGMSK